MSSSRTVYHGTTPLLEDAIRDGGLTGTAYVAGMRWCAEYFAWRAAGFALINGLASSPEGLLLTLEVAESRLQVDPERSAVWPLAAGDSFIIDGVVVPSDIVGLERLQLAASDVALGVSGAERWSGWPGALPEGQLPQGRRSLSRPQVHQPRRRERRKSIGGERWLERHRRMREGRKSRQEDLERWARELGERGDG